MQINCSLEAQGSREQTGQHVSENKKMLVISFYCLLKSFLLESRRITPGVVVTETGL